MKQLLTIILLFLANTLFAQTLYTRTDTLSITTDSVTLQAGTFRGIIQWQRSTDGQTWVNLTGKTGKTLNVYKTSEGFYRAQLTEGTCLPTYSDTAVIVANKPASNLITDPDNIAGATFIERDGGIFTFVGSSASIPINTVFVDSDKESDIRVVTSVTTNGDTLTVSTRQGTLGDLFYNTEFKLTTELLDNTNKSAYLSKEALAKSLVDKNGFIHPVRVIDNNAGNLKSVQAINDGSLPTVNFKYDFSGTTLWKEGGADISISEGYFQLGAKLDYEFKFESTSFDWNERKFPKGRVTHFKISTDKEKTKAEAKVILKAKTSGEFKDEDTETLKEMVFTKTFEYLIVVPPAAPIPFWATVTVDLMRDATASISGEASVSGGVTAGVNLEVGTSYDNGKWSTLKPQATPSLTLEGPTVDAKVNIQAKYEVYPRIDVAFYGSLAPYLEIGPYMREEMECSLAGNYKYDFCSGADARLGIRAEIFGEELFNHKTDDLNLYEDTLYTSPKKVKVVSGANQTASAGKTLSQPIVLKVVDSKDEPVKSTLVHFKASLGKLFQSLLSSPENAELKSAMLFASAGDSTQLAVASDTTGQVTINWTLADSTAKHQLEAYLMTGKDSIREDTRDTLTAEVECGCDTTKFEYFTDSRDGHKYKSIKIGDQIWMAENLAYLPYTTPTSKYSLTEPYYYVYDYAAYGALYNWPAAVNACPSGWHLPSDAEWTTLSNYLIDNGYGFESSGDDIAKALASTSGWDSSSVAGTPGNDPDSNNSSCFSALPGGLFDAGGYTAYGTGFHLSGSAVLWWSSSVYLMHYPEEYSWYRALGNFSLRRDFHFWVHGFSVRCVKN